MTYASKEPVVLANLVLTLLPALYGVLSSFDVLDLTDAQLGSLTGLYVAVAGIVIFLLRGTVYSPSSVQRISDAVELVRTAETGPGAETADAALSAMLPSPRL